MPRRWGYIVAKRPEVPRAGSTVANIVSAVVLLALAAAIPYVASNWDELANGFRDEVAAIPELEAEREQERATGSESLLLLVMDRTGKVGAMALAGSVDGEPSTLTVIPTSLFELLPGYGEFVLAESVGFEGPELARVAVANALGVRIDRVGLLPTQLIAGLPDLQLVVELNEPVVEQGDTVSFQIGDAGKALYDSGTIEELLTLQFDSSPVTWIDRQASVWRSLLGAMVESPTLAAQLLGDSPVATALARVAASDAEVSLIPVNPVAVAGAADGFQLVQADVAAFVADRLGHLALAAGERPRVEVLNGNGEILATRSVVDALVAAGFHVVKTDNADNFDFEETVVISQGRDNQDSASGVASVLGVRMVQLEVVAPSGVVDVSIIVGQDIATLRS